MTDLSAPIEPDVMTNEAHSPGLALRSLVIGLTAFLTVVDLFATQAILPSLTRHYGVTPAAMGFAVNASTFGMAVAGLVVGFFSPHIDRRTGILLSLALLAIPTGLLASAPNLAVFTVLRVAQGLCMAAAFALTLAYLGEQCSAKDAGSAFAAYITGNVATNLVGRLISAAVADSLGLAWNFYFFAALNLAGALLVYFTIQRVRPMHAMMPAASPVSATIAHWRDRRLRAAFGIGFCILFAFIGIFTFVNFVLVQPPLSLGMMDLGLVYFVFLPSVVTTLLAGKVAAWLGTRPTIWSALAVAGLGLPLMLAPHLGTVLAGMVLVGVGTFFAQAAATGFVGQAATDNRGIASGTYLACYFCGGLVGTAVLGRLFDALGWQACVAGVGVALALAALLTFDLKR
ncbi:putative MFS family arabinose efflux permease [Bradyrhizobium sp. R2.2-H]|jgi:predicted MFS family arabinose efflux permease|uniref:MFS transporter n=1 Tax=unclassified Bradyrhizobium TaxID=2631580 RepID=UPI001053C79D|nr:MULTISPECIES: MFS transporter [unclassified Bradyrhizobium]TCU78714.1 putative MFS family arabinose efflux permease [Bradyrhizobium sp. Y-H1]TCU80797.1 putative MFS family arabinose efflux permease [Bradyrhizobium sp. R2.2-H]